MSMNVNAPVNRLRTALPKIGIRPIVDGRYGGIRESLEGPTLEMAKKAAEFLTANVKHACGLPVEVVIADTCIGGVAEAAACEAKFKKEGVGVSLSVTRCWCYGSETMDMEPTRPKAIWGINATERPGAVYLAATLAAHAQKGLPCFGIYDRDVQNMDDMTIPAAVQEKLLRFARAGLAAATMRGNSYLSFGYTSMGIAGSMIDSSLFEEYLGMRVEFVDMSEMARRLQLGIFDPEEFQKALAWTKANCKEGFNKNRPEKVRDRAGLDADWETVVKMTLIARDLMLGNPKLAEMGWKEESHGKNAIAGGFQGQRQWTDFMPNGDFTEAMLCSGFDWNGIRQPFVFATENDSMNGLSMLFGHLLSGTAQMFSDVRTYWSPEAVKRVTGHAPDGLMKGGFIHLINSGASALEWSGQETNDGKPGIKPWYESTPGDAEKCLSATQWCPADRDYFRGGGYSSLFLTRGGMPMTMCRLNLVKGLGPVLQIAEGWSGELPPEANAVLDKRTDPTWPTTWFVPRTDGVGPFADVYSVMNAWGANHGASCYGHVGADLIALASMLRIPVDMHNVPEQQVFRPAVWNRFGAQDPQGADYRACAAYGPLYR